MQNFSKKTIKYLRYKQEFISKNPFVCFSCGFYDDDYLCLCDSEDYFYQCPKKMYCPESFIALRQYVELLTNHKRGHFYRRWVRVAYYRSKGYLKRIEDIL